MAGPTNGVNGHRLQHKYEYNANTRHSVVIRRLRLECTLFMA
jgi:hypothetical protein